jgi:hypothetical protein
LLFFLLKKVIRHYNITIEKPTFENEAKHHQN